jgi:peptidoglycan/LPS O-acetylase OafA/YrhL
VKPLPGRRDNNFNLLRMIAATAVLVSHAYPIALGTGAPEPLSAVLHINLGTVAVLTFFAISGYFISKSFHEGANSLEFWTARVLRLYPALLVVLLVTILVMGPACTTENLWAYFTDRRVFSYLERNLSLIRLQYDLPGVFHDNPYPDAINGSLWTLVYEVACYAMVALTARLGLAASKGRFIAFLGMYFISYAALECFGLDGNARIRGIHELSLPFVLGMVLYQFRQRLPLSAVLCGLLGAVALLTYGSPRFYEAFVLSWSYLIFYVGYLPIRPLKAYNQLGDYSYGMYLYAFPCEQLAVGMWKGISPLELIAISFPATLVCAVLSWHLLEKSALARRAAVAAWIARYTPRTGIA